MNASAAITDHRCDKLSCRFHGMPAGGLAARSINVLFLGRLPLSRLHAPVSLGDFVISRRTVTNNVG